MVVDVLYMMLVYLGVVQFLEAPFMKTFLWLFGFFVLTYTGIESLIGAGKLELNQKRGNETLAKSFMAGFFMSLSNPLTILFWLGIYGSVLANTATTYGFNQLLLYSGAIILGVLLWDITMAGIASSFRNFLNTKILIIISVLSGLSLIGFGLYFGYQAFLLLFT
jgi:L-lysine exporter family protein LysE/ArgO